MFHEVQSPPDPSNSRVQHSKEFPREALGTLQVGAQMREQQGASSIIKLNQKVRLPSVQLSKQRVSKPSSEPLNVITSPLGSAFEQPSVQ